MLFFYSYEIYDILILPYYKELSRKNSKLPNLISQDKTRMKYKKNGNTVYIIIMKSKLKSHDTRYP